jgi:hypothetical protein
MTDIVYAISVARQDTNRYVPGTSQGYNVSLTITVTSGFVDAGLFLFQVVGNQQNLISVCSPSNLVDWLLNQPNAQTGYVRLATCTLTYPSKDLAIQCTNDMLGQLQILCNEMSRLANDVGPVNTYSITSD